MNKRNLIITIVILLALIACFCAIKVHNAIQEEENMPELEAVQQEPSEEEVKIEEVKIQDKKVVVPVKKPEKQSIKPAKTEVSDKAGEEALKELEQEEVTVNKVFNDNGPTKVVVVDREYKMKSPDKYSFK